MKILVTGGCGFIGSNFIRYLLTDREVDSLVNLDAVTYAGRGNNIQHMGLDSNERYAFVRGDIADRDLVEKIFADYQPDVVVNFAAESHVDRSLQDISPFRRTNVQGVGVLLEASLKHDLRRFVQVSTDEVYGSRKEGSFVEDDCLNPSNPYAKTKAEAEQLVLAAGRKGLFTLVTRSANNYGQYQHPEKFLPRSITRLLTGRKIPLMYSVENPGLNVRDWLHVHDNCKAIWHVAKHGNAGNIYNIPGENERTNMEMAKLLLGVMGLGEEMIEFISHRASHDFRYSISGAKLKKSGFRYQHGDLREGVRSLVGWYRDNKSWWEPLLSEADK